MKYIAFVAAIAFASCAFAQEATIPVANTNIYQKAPEGTAPAAPAKPAKKAKKKAHHAKAAPHKKSVEKKESK